MSVPTLEVRSVADTAIKLNVLFDQLPASHTIVAAYILIADNNIGIKKFLIEDIPETDFAAADLRLTKLRNREPIEFSITGLLNGVNYGFRAEILHRLISPVTSPISIARSVGSVFGTPAGPAVPPLIQFIQALTATSFNITLENPIFNNPTSDGGAPISKIVFYLSKGRVDTNPNHPVENDVICLDFPVSFYAKNANGDLSPSQVCTLTDLNDGEQYEVSAVYVTPVGTGRLSTAQSLASGTVKFGFAKNIEASGNDGQGILTFNRPDNWPIADLVGAVLENTVPADSDKLPFAALYYKWNGSAFTSVPSKDDLTGSGFPFKTDPLFKYSIVVNNLPNNEPVTFKLRLINTFGEGLNLSSDISIIARASPGPIRNAKLVEYEAPLTATNWWTEYKIQKAKIDLRFITLRSGAVEFQNPTSNWPSIGGKVRVIQTAYDFITAAVDTAIKYFLSDALPAVPADAANGVSAQPAVPARNDSEKGLSELQIRSAIQNVVDSLTHAQWSAKSDSEKLMLAIDSPKMVSAIDMYFKIAAVSKDLQTLANSANGYQEINDDQTDDESIFDSRQLIKLFFIAGSIPTITLTARIIDAETGTLLQSSPTVIYGLVSARATDVIGQGSFSAGSGDITFSLNEYRRDQGLDLGHGKMTLALLNDSGNVVSVQTKLVIFDKSVSGKILRKNYSLATDLAFIINNGSVYNAYFEPAAAIYDTLSQISSPSNAKISGLLLAPKGKASRPNSSIKSNSDGSISGKFTALLLAELNGAAFIKYETYLVPDVVRSNPLLRGYTQAQLSNFLSSNTDNRVIRKIVDVNENNSISGFIQTVSQQTALKDYTWIDNTFSQGVKYTAISKTVTGSPESDSDWLVTSELQTFSSPSIPRSVLAVASGKNLEILTTWNFPTLDGRGNSDGSNLEKFTLKLYSGSLTTDPPLAYANVSGRDTRYIFTNSSNSANNQLVIGGSYTVSVQAYSTDSNGEAQLLKSTAVDSNMVTISTTPIISSASVSGNTVTVNWTPNGTTADQIFYAFAVQDSNSNVVDGEYIGLFSAGANQTSTTLTYNPTQPGYTLFPTGIIVLTTRQGQVAFVQTPYTAPAAAP